MAAISASLLLALAGSSLALEFVLPTQTQIALDGGDFWGWSPRPTSVGSTFDVFRRQAGITSVCGYISGLSGWWWSVTIYILFVELTMVF